MMEILKFNTQICTTIEQSNKLLELGLKPETSDMHYVRKTMDAMGKHIDDDFKEPRYGNVNSKYAKYAVMNFSNYETLSAWSLHRLIEMLPFYISLAKGDNRYISILKDSIHYVTFYEDENREITFNDEIGGANIYDNIIDCIEWLIKESYFNKEYLNETNK